MPSLSHTSTVIPLGPRGSDPTLHVLSQDQTSYLLVQGKHSLLVDCHSAAMRSWIDSRGLPQPELILHTHVGPEHCREGDDFPQARILVPAGLEEAAANSETYRKAARPVWDHPEDWPKTMGRERYGVAGCPVILAPEKPLKVAGTLTPGETVSWRGLTFEVIPLPAHGFYSVGLLLRAEGSPKPLALFIGDLFRHGPHLVDIHNLESSYGQTALYQVPELLERVAKLGAKLFLPATGPIIPDGPAQAKKLAGMIADLKAATGWSSGKFKPAKKQEFPALGRYIRLFEGVYQINNFGNCILFIDKQGRGLMVDPGPCDYEAPGREQRFIDDLVLLEKEAGLKKIEVALITHFHGDHVDMVPTLRRRYPGLRVAAWDVVARVIESPADFPYACRLPWYNIGLDQVHVDDVLCKSKPYYWNKVRIDSIHLPGHCYAHAAYLLEFAGKRLAITGDTVQSRGWPDGLNYTICNDSVPDDRRGSQLAYRNLLAHKVDFNIGGHGSHFGNPRPLYAESLRRIEHAVPYLKALVPEGDLDRACFRPWFPRVQPMD